MKLLVLSVAALMLAGCDRHEEAASRQTTHRDTRNTVEYYDRNADGRIDYEKRDFGCCDRDRALVDTDFDGRYDLEFRWGYVFDKRPVDHPVATGVAISDAPPNLTTE